MQGYSGFFDVVRIDEVEEEWDRREDVLKGLE